MLKWKIQEEKKDLVEMWSQVMARCDEHLWDTQTKLNHVDGWRGVRLSDEH